jgi:DNA-binding phage protein
VGTITKISHDSAVVEMLNADPDFASEYLKAALEEAQEPGGYGALLMALRHISEVR